MNFGFLDVLTLLGSLGFFIYGMKIMSEGIQKVAGAKMRQILRAMTSNRFFGIFTGFLLTGLVQSSSATTVMVVSFVNAGLLSLVESIGVIMGANIGTTITAWIISVVGFKVKIAAAALPIIAFGFPLLFSSRNKLKSWGEVIIGFAFLFMGLEALKAAVPDLKSNPQVLEFLSNYTHTGIFSIFLFVLIGTVITVIVQSSSATMALTLVMANQGWISFDIAAAMVLGENIGTTITANLAALVGNVFAKRAARAHLIFNLVGVAWMLIVFQWFLKGIDNYMIYSTGKSPFDNAETIPISLSIFHSAFNILNVLFMVGFVKYIAQIVTKLVKSKGEDEEFRLEYISTALMSTPEISLVEAGKELVKFGEIISRMSGFVQTLIATDKRKARSKLIKKVKKYEEITDRVEEEITDYLLKTSSATLSREASLRLRGILSIAGDLERIADLFYQISIIVEKQNESDANFTDDQIESLQDLFVLIDKALEIMLNNLKMDHSRISLIEAIEIEKTINHKRDKLRKKHLKRLEKGGYNVIIGTMYADTFNLLERIGDHIMNVSEAISGELAKDEEDVENLPEGPTSIQ